MPNLPDFDPYALLGVDADADAVAIDRAYKARIRLVHPDVAGSDGLYETKRLNVAREWLTDPVLRERLPRPARSWRATAFRSAPAHARSDPHPSWHWDTDAPAAPAGPYDPLRDDPLTYDYGPHSERVAAFFAALRTLTDDERARLTYSLGDQAPGSFAGFRELLGDELWGRSRALHDAVLTLWHRREDEIAPYDFPKGPFHGGGPAVANAYGQWRLLGEELRARGKQADGLDQLAHTCTWPWQASVGHARYGPNQQGVSAFLADAAGLSLTSAERLARSWERHMGRFLYGTPGEDWFPGADIEARHLLVSARLAAVDASRVEPPAGLAHEHRNGFHSGLRLTVHILALGELPEPRRDWLLPWKEAMDGTPTSWHRTRYGMPLD